VIGTAFPTLVGALLACTSGPDAAGPWDDSGGEDTHLSTQDSGSPSDTATTTDTTEFSGVTATRSEVIPTVFTVSWSSDGQDPGGVHFGHGATDLGMVAARAQGQGRWQAVLVGLPPETEVWFQLADGETRDPVTRFLTTGEGPDWWPEARALEGKGQGDPGFISVGFRLNVTEFYAVILNADGDPVWWMKNEGASGEGSSRVALSHDRQKVYWNTFHIKEPAAGRQGGFFVASLDGETVEFVSSPLAHHDFWLHEDGTLTYPAYDKRMSDEREITGDQLVERSPDGTERVLWTSWDTHEFVNGISGETPIGFYTIANQVNYDSAEDAYWVSVRNLDTILKLDRDSGSLIWQLGGDDSDFQVDSPFVGQHGFDVVGGDLLVHDNSSSETRLSRIVYYQLDEEVMTAELQQSYTYADDYYTSSLGDALALDDGNTLAIWSSAAEIQELTPEGTVVRKMGWEGEVNLSFGRHYDSLVR
jgi:hypothetical protein